MSKKEYPNIKLVKEGVRGNFYGAFDSNDNDADQGYTIFISNTKRVKSICECMGYIHGKWCYHLKDAKDLEVILFGK